MSAGAFYCVCGRDYFLGAVAMINSLRLQGHEQPIFVLDTGLEPHQRELLAAQATLVEGPVGEPASLLKAIAPARHPASVMVLIDTDMIVTRPLDGLIEAAAGDRVVAFEDGIDRYLPQWGELLGLGEARPGPYVCSALIAVGGEVGTELLALMEAGQRRVEFERTLFGSDEPGYPFRFLDQDVLNGILRTRLAPKRLVALEARLAATPPFAGLRIVDAERLRCRHADGTEPYLVHHHGPKPWLSALHEGVYSQLLRRLLVGPDLALRVPERGLPLRLRTGALAWADRKRIDAGWRWRWRVRGQPVTVPVDPQR